jgi:hypothetical protein
LQRHRRDNAFTPASADTPEQCDPPDHCRGCLANRIRNRAAVDAAAKLLHLAEEERQFLFECVDHVAHGGIVIPTVDGVVFTWADGGVARRKAAGHWG